MLQSLLIWLKRHSQGIIVTGVFAYLLFCLIVIIQYDWLELHSITIPVLLTKISLDDLGYVLCMSGGVIVTGYTAYIKDELLRKTLANVLINSGIVDIIMAFLCNNDYSAFAWFGNIIFIIGMAFYTHKKLAK